MKKKSGFPKKVCSVGMSIGGKKMYLWCKTCGVEIDVKLKADDIPLVINRKLNILEAFRKEHEDCEVFAVEVEGQLL